MKSFFTFLLVLCFSVALAQNPLYVHTATAATISGDLTVLDHPDLNGNPAAQLIVSHNWNPPGSAGIYNDNAIGVFWDGANWGIYHENDSDMIEGSSYNVYIDEGDNTFLHIADAASVGSSNAYTVLDFAPLNGNPDANIAITTYFNPNSLRNDKRYSVWYDSSTLNQWIIFTEDISELPLDTAFFVTIEGENVQNYTHVATVANIVGNYTEIDHALLNGDPDAVFVFLHNWGTQSESANVIVDAELGVWYTGTNWAIFTQDFSALPENSEYDLLIYDPSLGVEDFAVEGLNFFPNPAVDFITINAKDAINNVTVFDMQGRKVLEQSGELNTMSLNVSQLPTGNYLANVKSGDNAQVIKIIKK